MNLALDKVLNKVFKTVNNEGNQESLQGTINKLQDIIWFMQQVGHKFGEVVPQQRKYKLGDNYNDNLDINIETDANIRFNCLNQILYGDRNAGKKDSASSSIVTDLGILDFK